MIQKKDIKKLYHPHNKIFCSTMSDVRVARDFFLTYLPKEILPFVSLDNLELCPGTFISKELEESASDILYKTTIAGEDAYLFLLAEHQSSIDPLMPLRVLEYKTEIWRQHLKSTPEKGAKLPLILATVFYAGKAPWSASLDLLDLIAAPEELKRQWLYRPAHLVDSTKLENSSLQDGSLAHTLAYFLKNAAIRDAYEYVQSILNVLRELTKGHHDFVSSVLIYAIMSGETERIEDLLSLIREGLPSKIGEEVMTIAQQLINKGIQQGMQQGMQQGVQHGESLMLESILKDKFGHVPVSYMEKMRTADSETLLLWGRRFVNAKTLEEVFTPKH